MAQLISWNVNGIRACLKKGFLDSVDKINPDILCLQETRTGEKPLETEWPTAYKAYWNSAVRNGYAGTAVFSKIEPIQVTLGLGKEEHDQEGRVITLEFENYYLVNVYTPNSGNGLVRLPYRHTQWDVDFLAYCKNLENSKPVVIAGDLNVAHKEIDLANPKSNQKNAGFTPEERAGFDNIINAGFIDTFREFDKSPGKYTWWSMRTNARERNIGWRLDYFCISKALRPSLKGASILSDIYGSDHCPVGILLG